MTNTEATAALNKALTDLRLVPAEIALSMCVRDGTRYTPATGQVTEIRSEVVETLIRALGRDVVASGIRLVGRLNLRGHEGTGCLVLDDSELLGGITLERATLSDVRLQRCSSKGPVSASAFSAVGALQLLDCDIFGFVDASSSDIRSGVDLSGSDIRCEGADCAVVLDRATVGTIRATTSQANRQFRASGGFSLRHARVAADVNMKAARIVGSALGAAVDLDEAAIEGSLVAERVELFGGFRAVAASMSQLNLSGAEIKSPIGACLQATSVWGQNLRTEGTVFLGADDHVQSWFEGEIDLNRAQIGDSLQLVGAVVVGLANSSELGHTALNLTSAVVRRRIALADVVFEGAVGLDAVECESLFTRMASFNFNLDQMGLPPAQAAVVLTGARVRRLEWAPLFVRGIVNMSTLEVGVLVDAPAAWGLAPFYNDLTTVHLNRFPYRLRGMKIGKTSHMGASSFDAATRLRWLSSEQRLDRDDQTIAREIARDLATRGGKAGSIKVLVGAERSIRPRAVSRLWGYGYRVWPPFLTLLALTLLVLVTVGLVAQDRNIAVPSAAGAASPPPTAENCTASYPCFEPVIYGLDVLLPNAVGELGQDRHWRFDESTSLGRISNLVTRIGSVVGWLALTFLALSFTNIIRKAPD